MALALRYVTQGNGACDACGKGVGADDPSIEFFSRGRTHEKRDFITVHVRCFNRLGKREEKDGGRKLTLTVGPAQPYTVSETIPETTTSESPQGGN